MTSAFQRKIQIYKLSSLRLSISRQLLPSIPCNKLVICCYFSRHFVATILNNAFSSDILHRIFVTDIKWYFNMLSFRLYPCTSRFLFCKFLYYWNYPSKFQNKFLFYSCFRKSERDLLHPILLFIEAWKRHVQVFYLKSGFRTRDK